MVDYFKLAAALARAEGDATLKRIATKATTMRLPNVCGCSAYGYAHKAGAGNCPAVESINKGAADRAVISGAW